MNQYVVLRNGIRWDFPSSVERLAYVATPAERLGLAYQQSDSTLWILKTAPSTWVQVNTTP